MARKEAVFKMKLDSDDAVRDVKKLDKDFTSLRDTIEVDVSGSISAMEDRLYELAAAGDRNSKEFRELQKRTADYKKIVIETDRSIDALAEQGRGLSSALGIAEGTVAGFQAFTGITAVLGDENEELLETITKLQAAQGVLNSIELIKQQLQEKSIAITQFQTKVQKAYNTVVGSGTKVTKGFRAALAALGIGAIIAGIAALIANFDKLKSMITGVTKAQRLNNQVTDTAIENAAEELSALDSLSDTIKDENISREAKVSAVKDLQKQYPNLLANVDAEKTSTEELNRVIEANSKLVLLQARLKATQELRVEAFKEQIKEQMEVQRGENASLMDYAKAVIFSTNAQTEANETSIETIKAKDKEINMFNELEQSIKSQIDVINESLPPKKKEKETTEEGNKQRQEEVNILAIQLEARRKYLQQLREEAIAKRELDKFNKKSLEDTPDIADDDVEAELEKEEKINNLILKMSTTQREQEIAGIRTKYQKELQLAGENAQARKLVEQQMQQEIDQINQTYAQKERQRQLDLTNSKIDLAKNYTNSVNSLSQAVFEVSNNLGNQSQQAQEKRAKRQFNVQKALDITNAAIDTSRGITQAIAQFGPPPSPLGIAGITSASVIGAAQIAAIASKQFNPSGGGGGGSASAPSLTGASAGSFSTTSDDTSTDTTDLNPDGTQSGGIGSVPSQKVYVTEQDITNTQNKVKAVESISTF